MRTRSRRRLVSGLVALSTLLPATAYADDMHAEGNDNFVTVTGTITTQVQSPGQPDTGGGAGGGGGGADATDTGGADSAGGGGGAGGAPAFELCHTGMTGLKDKYVVCTPTPAPAAPQEEDAGTPPTTTTITAADTAALLVDGSGLQRQPPGPRALITLDVIAYTSPRTRTLTTAVAGTPVTITATPTAYAFDWGDGTTTTTTDPGAPYPHHTITHRYHSTATAVTITLTTTWTATYTPRADAPRPVQGTITTTETAPPFDLVRTTTQLTDDAEEAQGH